MEEAESLMKDRPDSYFHPTKGKGDVFRKVHCWQKKLRNVRRAGEIMPSRLFPVYESRDINGKNDKHPISRWVKTYS